MFMKAHPNVSLSRRVVARAAIGGHAMGRARGLAALVLGLALVIAQTVIAQARPAPEGFADLVEKISPAVVNITTTTTVAAPDPGLNPVVPEGSPFEEFFKNFRNGQGPQGRQRRSQALGSGFIISEDGYIVTNNHVIEGADQITVELFSGRELEATIVGTDPKTDIALLKVESDDPLPYVNFGDSDRARVGDWVMAIGNPLGQGFSVTAGIISARNRSLQGVYDDFIQTDAAINRGNSGGPLFNMDGEVIGVNTAILTPNGGSIGIGFSMASNVVSSVVEQLRQYGETRRGWLGVQIQDVTPDVAEALGLDDAAGALVAEVPEGPARSAGVEPGDVIVTFDGQHVENTRALVRMVGNAPVGKKVQLVVIRDGQAKTLSVVLGRREEAEAKVQPASVQPKAPMEKSVLGVTVVDLDDALRKQLGLDGSVAGVVVRDVDETSAAFAKGLRPGDLIVEAGQHPVDNVKAFEKQVQAAKDAGRKSMLLLIRRNGEPRFVALPLRG